MSSPGGKMALMTGDLGELAACGRLNVAAIERPPDAFQRPVPPSVLLAICRRALGAGADVRQIVELGVGTYNNTYRVELADGEPVILRIAPEPAHAGPGSPEAMRNEYAALPFLAPLGRLVPRTLAADFTHQLLDRDYLVQTVLPGVPASQRLPEYSPSALRHLYRELGAVTRTIHDVTGATFGPVAAPAHTSWRAALIAQLEQLADAYTAAGLDAGPVAQLIAACWRHRAALDEITVPALLHGDLWTLNLLVDTDPDRPTITGVLDSDTASWGDPLADWTITRALSKAGTEVDAFWQTYGRPSGHPASQDSPASPDSEDSPASQASQVRALIYRARNTLGARLDIHRRGLRLRDIPPVHWDVTDILAKLM